MVNNLILVIYTMAVTVRKCSVREFKPLFLWPSTPTNLDFYSTPSCTVENEPLLPHLREKILLNFQFVSKQKNT